jgi:hypothetical protein
VRSSCPRRESRFSLADLDAQHFEEVRQRFLRLSQRNFSNERSPSPRKECVRRSKSRHTTIQHTPVPAACIDDSSSESDVSPVTAKLIRAKSEVIRRKQKLQDRQQANQMPVAAPPAQLAQKLTFMDEFRAQTGKRLSVESFYHSAPTFAERESFAANSPRTIQNVETIQEQRDAPTPTTKARATNFAERMQYLLGGQDSAASAPLACDSSIMFEPSDSDSSPQPQVFSTALRLVARIAMFHTHAIIRTEISVKNPT